MSESSSSVPLTSFAASGGSLLTLTTTCDTPSPRISDHASRAVSSGVTRTRSGIEPSLLASTSPAHGSSHRMNPKSIIQSSLKIFDR